MKHCHFSDQMFQQSFYEFHVVWNHDFPIQIDDILWKIIILYNSTYIISIFTLMLHFEFNISNEQFRHLQQIYTWQKYSYKHGIDIHNIGSIATEPLLQSKGFLQRFSGYVIVKVLINTFVLSPVVAWKITSILMMLWINTAILHSCTLF